MTGHSPEVLVEVQGLKKYFGHIKAVDNINFKVHRGDILGFLGPNGAGKSTAMKIITCFLEPDAGTVRVAGHNIATDPLAVRQKIGYLPESAPAYGEMTVAGFLDFICDARTITNRKLAKERAVEMTGLEAVYHQTIETLSKGFKRRVGLAQALIHDPEVLILDEPTDGLDPNQKGMVQELITKIAKNKCIILSTHILDEVERVCTRALIISSGQILVDSTPEELMMQAPNHNQIRLALTEPNQAVIDKIRNLAWCKAIKPVSHLCWDILPQNGENHLADLLNDTLEGIEVASIHLQEGRLEDLFRNMTQGVCA